MIRLEEKFDKYYNSLEEASLPIHTFAYTIVEPDGYHHQAEIKASDYKNAYKKAQYLAGYKCRITDMYQEDKEKDDGEQLKMF